MALTKETTFGRLTIVPSGHVEIQMVTRVLEDGEVLGERYHRRVISPEDDITNEPLKLRQICNIARSM